MASKGHIKQGHVTSHVTGGGFQQVCDIIDLEIINFLLRFFFFFYRSHVVMVVVLIT